MIELNMINISFVLRLCNINDDNGQYACEMLSGYHELLYTNEKIFF